MADFAERHNHPRSSQGINFQSKMLPSKKVPSSNHWITGVVNIYLIATPTYPWNIPQTHNHLFFSGNPFIFLFWGIWWGYGNPKVWNGTFLTSTYLEKVVKLWETRRLGYELKELHEKYPRGTHPKTIMEPQNWWFVDVSPFQSGCFQVLC